MQDIDFDELDRAVNSALNTGGTSATPSTDTQQDDATTVPVTSSSTPTPPPAAAPAARRSGRFMDVVHPSSDMRSSTPERPAETPTPAEPAATSAPEASTPSEPTSPAPSSDMPDPLDFHGFQMEDSPAATDTPPPVTETPAQPLESPFLSDAKVEKRPLGAFSVTSEEPAAPPAPEAPAAATESVPEVPAEEPTPLLEAPDTEALGPGSEPLVETASESASAPAPESTPESITEPTPEPSAPVADETSSVPSSITQQYKEQPSTTDQPSGAIFDTESYHQPLAHPEKKKSGIWIIVWIVGLIVLGGGAGAVVYFFVLPLL